MERLCYHFVFVLGHLLFKVVSLTITGYAKIISVPIHIFEPDRIYCSMFECIYNGNYKRYFKNFKSILYMDSYNFSEYKNFLQKVSW